MHRFTPAGQAPEKGWPALVLIHGGGWTAGEPAILFSHARYFAARGLAVFVPQYRLAPKRTSEHVRAAALDSAAALGWVRAHAGNLDVNPNKVAIAGDSAGGHLAAIVALNDRLRSKGVDAKHLGPPSALIMLGAICDTRSGRWQLAGRWGKALSPIEQISKAAPPVLILHGEDDKVVPVAQARALDAAWREADRRSELVVLPDTGHAFTIPGYAEPQHIRTGIFHMDRFLAKLDFLTGEPEPEALRFGLIEGDR